MHTRLRRDAAVEFGFKLSRRNDQRVGGIDDFKAAASRMHNVFFSPEDAVRSEAITDIIDYHMVADPGDLLLVPVAAQLDDDCNVGIFAVSKLTCRCAPAAAARQCSSPAGARWRTVPAYTKSARSRLSARRKRTTVYALVAASNQSRPRCPKRRGRPAHSRGRLTSPVSNTPESATTLTGRGAN